MKRYNIKIKTKNKMIPIKGRMIRSPVEFSVPESKLSFYKLMIKKLSINEYTITDFVGEEIKLKKLQPENNNVNKPKKKFRDGKKNTLDKFL